MRRVISSVATILVVALGFAFPQSSRSATASPDWQDAFSGVPLGSGIPIAAGTLTARGLASVGATVVLFVLPQDSSQDAVPLSRTVTGTGGKWSIALPAGADLSGDVDPGSGAVNFYVQTFDGVGTNLRFFSGVASTSITAAKSLSGDTAAVDAGGASVNGASYSVTVDPSASMGLKQDSKQSLDSTAGVVPAAAGGGKICKTIVLANYDNIKTMIAYTADDANANTAEHVDYTIGASTTMGVGVQVGSGAWQASGTGTKSSSVDASFPATHNKAYQNYYTFSSYQKKNTSCYGRNNYHTSTNYMSPTKMDGGFTFASAAFIGMGNCSGVHAGVTVTKNSTAAYTLGGGVNVSGIIGINLSAQTGYSRSLSINYAMNNYGHPWCGLSDVPAGNSRLQDIHSSIWNG